MRVYCSFFIAININFELCFDVVILTFMWYNIIIKQRFRGGNYYAQKRFD